MNYKGWDDDDLRAMFYDFAAWFREANLEERQEIAAYMINLWWEWAKVEGDGLRKEEGK